MPRPQLYENPYGKQIAYRQTEKGQLATKKYETSEPRKAQKRAWKQENRGVDPDKKRQEFITRYGDPQLALSNLDEQEQQVVSWFYGLEDERLTLAEIGDRLGFSKQWAGKLKLKALAKLKRTT